MSTQNRRSVNSACSSPSSAKRPAIENAAKVSAGGRTQKPKKRAALGNLTNRCNVGRNPTRSSPNAGTGNQVCLYRCCLMKLFFIPRYLCWFLEKYVDKCLRGVLSISCFCCCSCDFLAHLPLLQVEFCRIFSLNCSVCR